jgi:hypothetical protein
MPMIEEEKFFAWLDGELEPEDAARVEAQVAADPELSRMAAEHLAIAADLRAAFGPIANAKVPEAIAAAAVAPPDSVVSFAAARKKPRAAFGAPQWAAMAAALALGIALGTTIESGPPAGPVEVRDGGLYAASAIDKALDNQLASVAAGEVRIGLTFRDRAGAICRTFTAAASTGLACRDDERWKLRGLFASPEGQSSDYRMAAGADPQLMALVDETIAGEPFDAKQEQAAKARHWK